MLLSNQTRNTTFYDKLNTCVCGQRPLLCQDIIKLNGEYVLTDFAYCPYCTRSTKRYPISTPDYLDLILFDWNFQKEVTECHQ